MFKVGVMSKYFVGRKCLHFLHMLHSKEAQTNLGVHELIVLNVGPADMDGVGDISMRKVGGDGVGDGGGEYVISAVSTVGSTLKPIGSALHSRSGFIRNRLNVWFSNMDNRSVSNEGSHKMALLVISYKSIRA